MQQQKPYRDIFTTVRNVLQSMLVWYVALATSGCYDNIIYFLKFTLCKQIHYIPMLTSMDIMWLLLCPQFCCVLYKNNFIRTRKREEVRRNVRSFTSLEKNENVKHTNSLETWLFYKNVYTFKKPLYKKLDPTNQKLGEVIFLW